MNPPTPPRPNAPGAVTHLPPSPLTRREPGTSRPADPTLSAIELGPTRDYAALLREDQEARSWAGFFAWERRRPLYNLCLVVLATLLALPLFGSGADVSDPLPRLVVLAVLANLAYCLVPFAALGLGRLGAPRRVVTVLVSGLALLLSLIFPLLSALALFQPPR